MRTDMQRLQPILRTLAWALLVLVSGPCLAEVGVVFGVDLGTRPSGPYELRSIIEDGDPVGLVWRVYSVSFDTRYVLNVDGEANEDGDPSLAYNRIGDMPMAAWARNSAGGYDLVLSCFLNGAWTEPLVLAEDVTLTQPTDPALVLDPADGSVHLLYWVDEAWPRVMYRHAPADLSSWSDPVQVSLPGELAVRPSGVFHDGLLHVAYEVHTGQLGGAPRQVVHAVEDGGGFTTEVIATTNHDGPNRPQVHGAGAVLWVDWIDADGEMTWTRRQATGPWEPIEIEPYTTNEQRDFHVRGAIEGQALD